MHAVYFGLSIAFGVATVCAFAASLGMAMDPAYRADPLKWLLFAFTPVAAGASATFAALS